MECPDCGRKVVPQQNNLPALKAFDLALAQGPPNESSRSPKWDLLRKKFLKSHPTCAASGGKLNLEVHHILPFHLFPHLELEPDNLIVLTRHLHFLIGHTTNGPWTLNMPNWSNYNIYVTTHSRLWLATTKQLPVNT